jgi:hypothetical protein
VAVGVNVRVERAGLVLEGMGIGVNVDDGCVVTDGVGENVPVGCSATEAVGETVDLIVSVAIVSVNIDVEVGYSCFGGCVLMGIQLTRIVSANKNRNRKVIFLLVMYFMVSSPSNLRAFRSNLDRQPSQPPLKSGP